MTSDTWHIDFSQYRVYQQCPAKWFESYIAKTRPAEKPGQQDSALVLGSLVHGGLQVLREQGKVEIPDDVVAYTNPKPETIAWARALVAGYSRAYPQEDFELFKCEEPIPFPLFGGLEGLAKVDYYFRVKEPTKLATGLGDNFVLQPGIYIKEYKTKDASRHLGNYVSQWRVNKQVDFQCLALRAKLGEPVQGVLIDVLEKPKIYQPKRKCPSCATSYEFADWQPTGDGYACPGCGQTKALDPPKATALPEPSYYRIPQARSLEELEASEQMIYSVAREMATLILRKEVGLRIPQLCDLAPATETHCVDGIFGPCAYFEPHASGVLAAGHAGFVQIEDPWEYLKR